MSSTVTSTDNKYSSSNTSRLEFAECQQKQAVNTQELPSYAAQIAKSMNLQTCTQTSSAYERESGIDITAVTLVGGINVDITESEREYKTSVIGCEQVAIMARRNYETSQKIKCVLSQISSNVVSVVSAINNIRFEAKKDLTFDCPQGLNFDQSIDVKINNSSDYTDSQIEEITETLQQTTSENIKTIQESKTGFAATPQGQKVLSETINKVESNDFRSNIKQTVIDISTKVSGKNSILISSGGNLMVNGKNCTINQDIVIDIVAQTMINNTLNSSLQQYMESSKEYAQTLAQKSVAEGMPVGGGQVDTGLIIKVIIGILIGGVCIGGGYFIYKNFIKKDDGNPSV